MLRSVNNLLLDTLNVAGKLLLIVVAIMCVVCMTALVVLWITDELEDRRRILNILGRKNQSIEAVANAADDILTQYYAEHNRAEDAEEKATKGLKDASVWDKNRQAHIEALEKQLRENNIEPIKWQDIKFDRKAA